ncbi:hypothetical protein [Pseudomonas maumuensis]|uniref:Uncharacterized protein n=1 Tax=Pseudomonas maumuensis TaxID=2842354 RepID=A0ABX8NEL2_9PSED|nr:hypothetical protein [Pseudomonas maumuensis]QXH54864.1 hypothetical protein KSS90_16025 [Pseudomonas maumuensis]
MDNYDSSALGLQKCLLNLRRDHARMKAAGDLERAAVLAQLIERMEQGLQKASQGRPPQTLQ